MKTIIVTKGFEYDEDLFVEAGEYEYIENGINGYPMIKVDDEWLDICNPNELQ